MPRTLAAIPWSLLSVALIIVVCWGVGVFDHAISATTVARYGIGLRTLAEGKLWTLVTANFLVDHPKAILTTVPVGILGVGWCELRFGTLRTVLLWFLGTWVSLTFEALAYLPARLLVGAAEARSIASPSVGSSDAMWFCVGAVIGLPWRRGRLERWAVSAIVLFLLVVLVVHHQFNDLEHIVVLACSMVAGEILMRSGGQPIDLDWNVLVGVFALVCACLFALTVRVVGLSWATAPLLLVAAALALVALSGSTRAAPLLGLLLIAGGALALSRIPNVGVILTLSATIVLLVAPLTPLGHPHLVIERERAAPG